MRHVSFGWIMTHNTRVYVSKATSTEVKHEPFYPSDYQKKIDFTGISSETRDQIGQNNEAGDYAEAYADAEHAEWVNGDDAPGDQLDKVIKDKVTKFKADKKSGKIKTKPPYDITGDDIPEGMRIDGNGNLTDLPADE